jgi:ABC-2 type transport system ATP-binding protein
MLARLGFADAARTLVRALPLGWRQKLAFSVALLHQPRIVFLDEPTSGVDPITRRQFWELIYEAAAAGTTVLVTTHYMDEAEYCDRIAIIDHGQIVALDTPNQLKAMVGGDVVSVRTDDNELAIRELRERWGLEPQVHGDELRLEVPRGDEFVPELVRGITPRVEAISIHRPTLDDVFVKLTGRAIREQESSDLDVMRQFGRAWAGRR